MGSSGGRSRSPPNYQGYSVADVTGDGRLEFAFSSGTPHNGATVGGTDDRNTYTIIVDESGRPQLVQRYPFDTNTRDALLDAFVRFREGEPHQLVSFKTHEPPYRGTSRIHLRDLAGAILHTHVGLQDARWFFGWADLNGDGTQQVVASNWSSAVASLTVFDRHLNVEHRIDLGRGPHAPVVRAIADVNGDGHPQVLVTRGRTLSSYDRALRRDWSWDADGNIWNTIVADLDGNGRLDVIVLTDGGVTVLEPPSPTASLTPAR